MVPEDDVAAATLTALPDRTSNAGCSRTRETNSGANVQDPTAFMVRFNADMHGLDLSFRRLICTMVEECELAVKAEVQRIINDTHKKVLRSELRHAISDHQLGAAPPIHRRASTPLLSSSQLQALPALPPSPHHPPPRASLSQAPGGLRGTPQQPRESSGAAHAPPPLPWRSVAVCCGCIGGPEDGQATVYSRVN